jgi:hypothetical protein
VADQFDIEIRVQYNYIVRQRDDWRNLAPDVGKISALLRQLQWQGEPRSGGDSRPVTFLRPILAQHQRVIDWVNSRVSEGAESQLHMAERLAEIVALYETNTETHQRLLRTIVAPR